MQPTGWYRTATIAVTLQFRHSDDDPSRIREGSVGEPSARPARCSHADGRSLACGRIEIELLLRPDGSLVAFRIPAVSVQLRVYDYAERWDDHGCQRTQAAGQWSHRRRLASNAGCGHSRIRIDSICVASVLYQAADRDGSDMAGRRNGPRHNEADIDQR